MAREPSPEPLRPRFDAALLRDDPAELGDAVVEVGLEARDREWAECSCARLTKHRNATVRGNALLALGHLARRFGHLDRNRVLRLIETGLFAHHAYVREQAESAAVDIETFLGWRFERPPPEPGGAQRGPCTTARYHR